MSIHIESLANFLVQAKLHTYASQDRATVRSFLNGSKQLEFRSGDYFYRDIYFGFTFFAGQETVEYKDQPIWSMVYSGGVVLPESSREETAQIYTFLRKALRQVDTDSLYRGPSTFLDNSYLYKNDIHGSIDNFFGYEVIEVDHQKAYELRYNGGIIH